MTVPAMIEFRRWWCRTVIAIANVFFFFLLIMYTNTSSSRCFVLGLLITCLLVSTPDLELLVHGSIRQTVVSALQKILTNPLPLQAHLSSGLIERQNKLLSATIEYR